MAKKTKSTEFQAPSLPDVDYGSDRLTLRDAKTTKEALDKINAYYAEKDALDKEAKKLSSDIQQAKNTESALKTTIEVMKVSGPEAVVPIESALKALEKKTKQLGDRLRDMPSVPIEDIAKVSVLFKLYSDDDKLFKDKPYISSSRVYGIYTYLRNKYDDKLYDKFKLEDLEKIIGYRLNFPFYETLDEDKLRKEGYNSEQIEKMQRAYKEKQKAEPFARGLTRAQIRESNKEGGIERTLNVFSSQEQARSYREVELQPNERLRIPAKTKGLDAFVRNRTGSSVSRQIATYSAPKTLYEKMGYTGPRDELAYAAAGNLEERLTFVFGSFSALKLVVQIGFTRIDFGSDYATALQVRLWYPSIKGTSTVLVFNITGRDLVFPNVKYTVDAINLIKGEKVEDTSIEIASESTTQTVFEATAQRICEIIETRITAAISG